MEPRVIFYVDASNLLVEVSKAKNLNLRADKPTKESVQLADELIEAAYWYEADVQRKYWFGSHHCSTEEAMEYRLLIRERKFEPVLLKRAKGKGEKGVDIALATQFMADAYNNRFDRAVLVAGDEDYAPVIREIRRSGHFVTLLFLEGPTSDMLRVECDRFVSISEEILGGYTQRYHRAIANIPE